jgi:hypothetical protein
MRHGGGIVGRFRAKKAEFTTKHTSGALVLIAKRCKKWLIGFSTSTLTSFKTRFF